MELTKVWRTLFSVVEVSIGSQEPGKTQHLSFVKSAQNVRNKARTSLLSLLPLKATKPFMKN